MAKKLIIVESPAKIKTILKFLDKDYDIVSSYGHIRALPRKNGSVDVDNDFAPVYQILPEKKKVISGIKKRLKGVEIIYLATDMDREGEAIAWHLSETLELAKKKVEIKRITFNEITKKAVTQALQNPRDISANLVDAQKARVILDYLVGFNLSPFLWKKVRGGLSAGRVQSVALKLICDRESEINAFDTQEYWSITSELYLNDKKRDMFNAALTKIDNKKIDKLFIKDKEQSDSLLEDIEKGEFVVSCVAEKKVKRNPTPPFITSTLQQGASTRLGFRTRKTMMVAQRLYEGVDIKGESVALITYMRTDSVRLADDAIKDITDVIKKRYGDEYVVKGGVRVFKRKVKNAQEAHEAIRPTDAGKTPESLKKFLKPDEFNLYKLIWQRAVASQMAPAEFKNVSADMLVSGNTKKKYIFHATGSTMLFDGFLKVFSSDTGGGDLTLLPPLKKGQKLNLAKLTPEQHFTQPPPRYSEATLVKTLEEHGIGRPSTYASIIHTLLLKKYVIFQNKRFKPEDVGVVVSKLLSEHFSKYVDYGFTASLEEELDDVAKGKKKWQPLLKQFWEPFIAQLKQKEADVKRSDVTSEDTDEKCPECSANLKIRLGRAGKFYGCSSFPDCRYTRPLDGDVSAAEPETTDEVCEKCGEPMAVKVGRYGKFLGCSGYPKCKNIQSLVKAEKTGVKCPGCKKGELTKKVSRRFKKTFYACDKYPKCRYVLNFKPVPEKCPKCGSDFLLEKKSKTKGSYLVCATEKCEFTKICDEK